MYVTKHTSRGFLAAHCFVPQCLELDTNVNCRDAIYAVMHLTYTQAHITAWYGIASSAKAQAHHACQMIAISHAVQKSRRLALKKRSIAAVT